MLAEKLKIDAGVRILTFGSIAIVIASFLKSNNSDADVSSFIFSGILLIFSGIFYIMCNFFEIPDLNGIVKQKNKRYFLPILILKQGCFGFLTFRIFSVTCLYLGTLLFLIASIELPKSFILSRSALASKFSSMWGLFVFVILIALYSLLLPGTYKDFE